MSIRDLVTTTNKLQYKEICSALIDRFGVKQSAKWDSVLPNEQQQTLFGGEVLRLISEHPTLASQKEIRPICLMKGELSQLLFFYIQLKDEKLPKSVIERIARKFVGGAAADRYIIWFFGNKAADILKIVISGKEGKKIKLKTLTLEAGQWFKTYDYILSEVERRFNTDGLFQDFKEASGLWKALWEAFDISIVNKKFYAEIKAVFDALTKEELPKCKGLLTNDQDRVQFAIRLIGRIIFCWFLKRKGIVTGEVMSSRAVEAEQNYYRDILEPLFFDVFNTPLNERKKDLPESIKNYPFLNGGLFEPQHQDHKGNWALNISNNWFINFFNNTLERYNFTVDENSAASSEIAIDPEMLGRIFENLLAEQNPETGESARKSTGSYYTPREIVDFMVEESLIAYLKTLKGGQNDVMLYPLSKGAQALPDDAIEDFVHTGSLPDSLKPHSKELFERLNSIKVLDPACGSGAFPISMLQKLAGLKHQLAGNESPYNIKLKTIENSIYGVDIQPMATELSRLRCWLSLIVDEDPKDIKPLPNLDFKFVTANSLIDLGYDEFLQDVESGKIGKMFLGDFLRDMDALKAVRQKYFEPSLRQKEKDKLKKDFNATKDDLFKMSLELIKQRLLDAEFANKVTGWDPFDDSKSAPFFNKSWMFGVEDGFDLVIANPPYIRHEAIKPIKPQLSKRFGKFYCGTADIYTYFYKAGIDSLRPSGHLCFIAPNKFMRAGYGKNTRTLLTTEATPKLIIDFCELPVFEAGTDPAVILVGKSVPSKDVKLTAAIIKTASEIERVSEVVDERGFRINVGDLSNDGWTLELGNVLALMEKLRKAGKPLREYVQGRFYRGILTGLNEAFVINEETKTKLIAEDPKSAELIKPWLDGHDILKWRGAWNNRYVIAIASSANKRWPWSLEKTEQKAREIFKKTYPTIYKHFIQSEEKLIKRDDQGKFWWELRSCSYYEEFDQPKLVFNETSKELHAYVDYEKVFINKTGFIIVCPDNEYLLGILNSRLMDYYFRHNFPAWGDPWKGGRVQFRKDRMVMIPVAEAAASQKAGIIKLVETILADPKSSDVSSLETEINIMVYALYGLTPEEIAIVEGKKY